MDLGDALVIAPEETPQHFGQVAPLLGTQAADDAEIDGGQLRRRRDEQIAFVQVGMESAVVERLAEEGTDQVVGRFLVVKPGQGEGFRARQRRAVGPFGDQNAARHLVPDDLGRLHPRFLVDDLADFVAGRGFEAQVEFEQQRLGDRGDEGDGLKTACRREKEGDDARRQGHHGDVGGDDLFDAGAQDLDRHLAAIEQDRFMGLGDRGRADNLAEMREDGIDRLAERFDHAGLGHGARKGRQLVLQVGEVGNKLATEDIAARRQHLAELDEGRPQLLEGDGVAFAGAQVGLFGEERPQDRHEKARIGGRRCAVSFGSKAS